MLGATFCVRKMSVTHSCPTLCNPIDCSLQGSSLHEILQARILEWVAIPFSMGSSQPRDQTQLSCIAGEFFTVWATRETPFWQNLYLKKISLRNSPWWWPRIMGKSPLLWGPDYGKIWERDPFVQVPSFGIPSPTSYQLCGFGQVTSPVHTSVSPPIKWA